jgi:hypothetical protein
MVNLCELLLNTVSIEVPKLLLGINQKVCGWSFRSRLGMRRYIQPPVKRQNLSQSCDMPGTW